MQAGYTGAERQAQADVRWGACVKLRGVTRDRATGDVGLSFLAADGIHRLRISGGDANFLLGALEDQGISRRSHSDSSSGSPASDGSKPLEGKNVCPPTRSSSAASGLS